MFVGNPKLKDYLQYNAGLNYDWTMNSRWTLLSYASLHISNPQNYELYRYDDERKMFVYQNLNGSKSLSQHYELALQYDIIPQIFSLRPVLIYDHMDVSLWKDFSFDRFFFCCSLFYMHNGWSFDVNYMAPSKYMKITSGLMTHFPGMLGFGAGYSISNWNIDLYMQTPYKAVSKGHLQQIGYERRYENRIPRVSDHVISLSVNYRFTFGKKKHKFDNSVIQDTNQSTISSD